MFRRSAFTGLCASAALGTAVAAAQPSISGQCRWASKSSKSSIAPKAASSVNPTSRGGYTRSTKNKVILDMLAARKAKNKLLFGGDDVFGEFDAAAVQKDSPFTTRKALIDVLGGYKSLLETQKAAGHGNMLLAGRYSRALEVLNECPATTSSDAAIEKKPKKQNSNNSSSFLTKKIDLRKQHLDPTEHADAQLLSNLGRRLLPELQEIANTGTLKAYERLKFRKGLGGKNLSSKDAAETAAEEAEASGFDLSSLFKADIDDMLNTAVSTEEAFDKMEGFQVRMRQKNRCIEVFTLFKEMVLERNALHDKIRAAKCDKALAALADFEGDKPIQHINGLDKSTRRRMNEIVTSGTLSDLFDSKHYLQTMKHAALGSSASAGGGLDTSSAKASSEKQTKRSNKAGAWNSQMAMYNVGGVEVDESVPSAASAAGAAAEKAKAERSAAAAKAAADAAAAPVELLTWSEDTTTTAASSVTSNDSSADESAESKA